MPSAIDLSGRKFGNLTAYQRQPRSYWDCACICGQSVRVRGDHLVKGLVRSCGCLRKTDDLVGKRFGGWVVLRRADPPNAGSGTPLWDCLCDCGIVATHQASNLRSGATQSCGCLIALANVSGVRYGRLQISARLYGKPVRVICKCDCGNEHVALYNNIVQGRTVSCGCFQRESARIRGAQRVTHGQSRGRVYRIWSSMHQRCSNDNTVAYHRYGGRGITVCERWDDFEVFYADMGDPPSKAHSLDRKKNDLGYCKENCRWATPIEQARNKTSCKYITAFGSTHCISAWADITGVRAQTISRRLQNGWAVERAVSEPSRPRTR